MKNEQLTSVFLVNVTVQKGVQKQYKMPFCKFRITKGFTSQNVLA